MTRDASGDGGRPVRVDQPPAHKPIGALDDVERGSRVAGWARIEGADTRVAVEILVDGVMVGSATADQYRDDLDRNGWGDCAFWFDLPGDLLDGEDHAVDLRFAETGERLRHAPRTFVLERRAGAADGLIGAFDGIEGDGWAAGWARRRDGADRLTIEAWIDGTLAGRVIADQVRDDLQRDGGGDCAFWFGIPEFLLDGRDHHIDLRYAGTDQPLPGSPRTFRIHRADALLTDGVNLIATASFDFWPNGLRLTPRERFDEIVSGWYYDFRCEPPPIVTIEADRPHDIGLPRDDYAMRITVAEGGADAGIRLVVPIAPTPADLERHRFSIGLHRSPSASDDMLHVSQISIATVNGLTVDHLTTVHRTLNPRGAMQVHDLPVIDAAQALRAVDPAATLALVIDLHGDGELTLFSPALVSSTRSG